MGSQKKKTGNRKVVPYRRPKNLNVGMIIFAIIFVYMSFSVYTYLKREKVQVYEVVEGGIVNEKDYTGIILREESTKYTERAGYIQYYIREGKRAGIGAAVYSVDETGSVATFLAQQPELSTALSEENLLNLKKQLNSFSLTYTDENFRLVYDRKYSLEALVLEYANINVLDSLDGLMTQEGINFHQIRSDEAGIISYAIDSFEDLDPAGINEELFAQSVSTPLSRVKAGEVLPAGSPVYKVVTSDDWSIIFPMSEEDLQHYGQASSLTVSFAGMDLMAQGAFSTILGEDGKAYGKLDFQEYMVQFLSQRFIQFEIVSDRVTGLKIPISAVTDKTFYLVPVDYLAQGGDKKGSATGFMKEVYSEQGTSVVFVPATIYYSTEEYYYIDIGEGEDFKVGDYLVKPTGQNIAEEDAAPDADGVTMEETHEDASQAARAAENEGRFQISASASLQGVYNINKGYAVFKQIEVLASNDEYYTIRKGVSYGLAVYDHIVLDASTVEEGKQIYQ